MEFLMTYGWAILVVLLAIAALASFGFFKSDFDKQFSICVDEEAIDVGKFYVGNEINAIKISCCEKLGRTPITNFAGEFVLCADFDNSYTINDSNNNSKVFFDETDQIPTIYLGLEGGWQCIEWANKTKLKPEYFDNCCAKLDLSLYYNESEEYELTFDENTSKSIKFENKNETTLYEGGWMCFDGRDDFESIQIENQSVNLAKCRQTEKYLVTNETICIVMKLANYGQYQD